MKFIYLHGFASSPSSRKAEYFARKLFEAGCDVEVPHLEAEGFRNLTISGQMEVIKQVAGTSPVRLIGSSMGGYLAALYASLHPEVDRVLLLAPAFGFAERWILRLGEASMETWRTQGTIEMMHYATGKNEPVGYGLIEDGLRYPAEPDFFQPALIYHGRNDDVVPVSFSRHFAASHSNVVLHEIDSDHALTDAMKEIWDGSREFLLA